MARLVFESILSILAKVKVVVVGNPLVLKFVAELNQQPKFVNGLIHLCKMKRSWLLFKKQ